MNLSEPRTNPLSSRVQKEGPPYQRTYLFAWNCIHACENSLPNGDAYLHENGVHKNLFPNGPICLHGIGLERNLLSNYLVCFNRNCACLFA